MPGRHIYKALIPTVKITRVNSRSEDTYLVACYTSNSNPFNSRPNHLIQPSLSYQIQHRSSRCELREQWWGVKVEGEKKTLKVPIIHSLPFPYHQPCLYPQNKLKRPSLYSPNKLKRQQTLCHQQTQEFLSDNTV